MSTTNRSRPNLKRKLVVAGPLDYFFTRSNVTNTGNTAAEPDAEPEADIDNINHATDGTASATLPTVTDTLTDTDTGTADNDDDNDDQAQKFNTKVFNNKNNKIKCLFVLLLITFF